jgi:hypothetical protein
MEELEKSLKIITEENNNNNIIIAGDFNCPDIQWETLSLKHEVSDKDVHRMLIDYKISLLNLDSLNSMRNQQGRIIYLT